MSAQDKRHFDTLINLIAKLEKYGKALKCPEQLTAAELIRLEGKAQSAAQELDRAISSVETEKAMFSIFGKADVLAAYAEVLPGFEL